MKYKEIKVKTTIQQLDPFVLWLEQQGITGLIISDPREAAEFMAGKETWHWDYVDEDVLSGLTGSPSVTFYVKQEENIDHLLSEMAEYTLEVALVDDQDWLHKWKEYFVPARITPRIVVKPAWAAYSGNPEDIVIDIDPGMAFGTGTHATTTLCMRLLEMYMEPGDDVMDVGSGTGILSVAAAFLDAHKVLSLDLDPEAILSTRQNVLKNGVSDRVEVKCADLTKNVDFIADVVIANLMADLVVMLSKDVAKHLKGKSIYIASGILKEKENFVREALLSEGFEVLEVLYEDEWCAIASKRS